MSVYFIQSARSKAVKIGHGENVQERLSGIQVGSHKRLRVIAQMPGDHRFEKALHERFAVYRIRGEWFRLEGDLALFVSLLPIFDEVRPLSACKRRALERKEDRPVGPTKRQLAACNRALKAGLRYVGVDRFMEATGMPKSKRHLLSGFLHDRVRKNGSEYDLRLEWVFQIVALCDEAHAKAIVSGWGNLLGLEVLTREESLKKKADDAAAALRIENLRRAVVETMGEEGVAFLKQFDDELDAEIASRYRAKWASPDYLGPTEAQMQWRHRRYGDALPRGIKPWPAPEAHQ